MAKAPLSVPVLRPFEVVIWGERKDAPLHREFVNAYSEDEAKAAVLGRFRATLDFIIAVPKVTRVDVLDGFRHTPQKRQHGLFDDLAEVCLGSSMDDVQGASVNLLLTAVQRRAANQADALARWDDLARRGRDALVRRYSGQTDQRDKAAESEIGKRLFA